MIATPTLTRPTSRDELRERRAQTSGPVAAGSVKHGLAYQPQPTDLFIHDSPFFWPGAGGRHFVLRFATAPPSPIQWTGGEGLTPRRMTGTENERLVRDFVADICGEDHEPYLTFRDGWRYQVAVDTIRQAGGGRRYLRSDVQTSGIFSRGHGSQINK